MPPKKKAMTKNGFFFYMLDFKVKKESEGVRFPGGMKEVADAAGPSWKGLDPKSKQAYVNIAERCKVAGNGGVRYTTQGQTYDEVDAERREAETRKQTMLKTIKSEVEAGGQDGLKSHNFYFAHVNHYGAMEDHRFIPCEMAFLAYNIQDGFLPENIYHTFIQNMELPNGYTFRAKSQMEATHKCPLPPHAMGSSDHQKMYDNILGLMEKNGDLEDGRPPPVYTLAQFIPEVVDFFSKGNEFLHSVHHVTRIYPLEELFFQMKNFGLKPEGQHLFFNGVEDIGFMFNTNAIDILKGDIYDYSSGIACQFHEDEDVRQHCSRSYVIRWSYLLSDHLCANLDVKIVGGRHTPSGTDLYTVKITSQMDQLRLNTPVEAPRETCGRGRPVDGRSVPMGRPVVPTLSRNPRSNNDPSTSRCSSRASSRSQNETPLTIIDHSQFQKDDFEPVPSPPAPRPVSEDVPLRAPKTMGKSSILLNNMRMAAAGSSGDADQLPLGIGRGRAKGRSSGQPCASNSWRHPPGDRNLPGPSK